MSGKLTSRKFWVCVAAMLASIATSIAGLASDNQTVLAIGTVCGVASAAIYAFCEAWVDAKAAGSDLHVNELHFDQLEEENEEES